MAGDGAPQSRKSPACILADHVLPSSTSLSPCRSPFSRTSPVRNFPSPYRSPFLRTSPVRNFPSPYRGQFLRTNPDRNALSPYRSPFLRTKEWIWWQEGWWWRFWRFCFEIFKISCNFGVLLGFWDALGLFWFAIHDQMAKLLTFNAIWLCQIQTISF